MEISYERYPGKNANDTHNIIDRVFRLKLGQLEIYYKTRVVWSS